MMMMGAWSPESGVRVAFRGPGPPFFLVPRQDPGTEWVGRWGVGCGVWSPPGGDGRTATHGVPDLFACPENFGTRPDELIKVLVAVIDRELLAHCDIAHCADFDAVVLAYFRLHIRMAIVVDVARSILGYLTINRPIAVNFKIH